MSNNLSQKERRFRKTLKSIVIVTVSLIVALTISGIILQNHIDKLSKTIGGEHDVSDFLYTEDELAHDHDGDGKPDH